VIKIPRLPWDEFFMLHAHLAATRSTCDRGPDLLFDPGRRGVGSVFVRDKRIIAGGYNGSPPGEPHCDSFECYVCDSVFEGIAREGLEDGSECPCCGTGEALRGGHLIRDGHCVRTLHAEENALIQCALDGVSPTGATVYTSASPCYDCAKRLVRVGVVKVFHGEEYGSRYGLSNEAVDLLKRAGIEVEHLDVSEVVRGPTFSF
jgi:dCMP deaminase